MLTRRDFLRGLLATAGAAMVARNGILQPTEEVKQVEQDTARPDRTIFDMAQNTWRQDMFQAGYQTAEMFIEGIDGSVYVNTGTLPINFESPVYVDQRTGKLVPLEYIKRPVQNASRYSFFGYIIASETVLVHFNSDTPADQLRPSDVIYTCESWIDA